MKLPHCCRSHQLYSIFVVTMLLMACSSDETSEQSASATSTNHTQNKNSSSSTQVSIAPEACEAGQVSVESGYQNFPGMQCSQIANTVATYTERVGFRKQCQEKTGASSRPKTVARVQVKECGPLRQEDGHYASMLVCCNTPVTKARAPVMVYEAKLECPDGHFQALASNLHYPGKNCIQAVIDAESKRTIPGYKRACAEVSGSTQPQTILNAAAFTCREEAGAMIDVAICCSSTMPKGKEMHPIEVPADLWEALRINDLFGLQLLLSRHPERVHERGEQGTTPLHLAGNLAITNLLISKRPNLEAKDQDGFTPLHYAVMHGNAEAASRLLELKAAVDARSNNGDTPLSFAKSSTMAALLLTYKANPDGGGSASPLHTAAFYGRTDVAALLLQHGANINSVDTNGETPLHRAAFRQQVEMVRLLIQKGAEINAKSASARPRTPLDMTDNPEIKALITSNGGVSGK